MKSTVMTKGSQRAANCTRTLPTEAHSEPAKISVEKLARELFIQNCFGFYGKDGEASWSFSKQLTDEKGRLTGRWVSKHGGDCGELNRKAAEELWDTGKYEIRDYGGDDFDFTCDEKKKDIWRAKARALLKVIL